MKPGLPALAVLCALLSCTAGSSHDAPALEADRERMVRTTIARPTDGRRPVRDPRVIEAMQTVPRHRYMPAEAREWAYQDTPAPIGQGQTISQPYIVALMTELLEPAPEDVILEVGTGSGYQAAVLSDLVDRVYTIEIVEELAARAAEALHADGRANVELRVGDGYAGWPEHAPFDGIVVTAAPDHVPEPLKEQLAVGGRLVIPVGPRGRTQELLVLTRHPDGSLQRTAVIPVRFVPFTGPGVADHRRRLHRTQGTERAPAGASGAK